YSDMNSSFSQNFVSQIDEIYKKNIITNKQNTDDIITNEIYRQLKRLKYCVKGMSYSLAISHKNFVGILDNQDNIHVYSSVYLSKQQDMRLYVISDLKTFYNRIETVEEECDSILYSVYDILNRNQTLNANHLKSVLEKRDTIINTSNELQTKKDNYM